MLTNNRLLYLCAGLQSSGSTLISWCFLQRGDTDGILDANNDEFANLALSGDVKFAWIKTTISSFRMSEQLAHYQDQGWTVRPLLICRDVREVYASLRTKEYGRNGTTAEDPPLRLRFRRFREDWDLFQEHDWPILCYEQFLKQPEQALRNLCVKLGMPWDAAMLNWPKPRSAIHRTRHGNETFRQSCGANLWASLLPAQKVRKPLEQRTIPAGELAWLEREFAYYNQVNDYPAHVAMQPAPAAEEERTIPSYDVARRYKWKLQQTPVKYLLTRITRWFKSEPTPAPRQAPTPTPVAAAIPCAVPPKEIGDDSRTNLGEYVTAGI